MGMDVTLYKYNWKELISKLKKIGVRDTKKLQEMLLLFGKKCYNTYYLLNNEYWEDSNSHYGLPSLIDDYFRVKNSFDVFLDCRKSLEMCVEVNEVIEKMRLNL